MKIKDKLKGFFNKKNILKVIVTLLMIALFCLFLYILFRNGKLTLEFKPGK